jgi:hypothetical protein
MRRLTDPMLLAFIEAFLVAGLPLWGLSAAGTSNGTASGHIVTWPALPMMVGGALAGVLNGIRAIRNLRTEPPK